MIGLSKLHYEAKFLRGLAYYHLTLWWNEVPLRTTPVVDQNSNHVAPSAVDIIYDQIVSDLITLQKPYHLLVILITKLVEQMPWLTAY